MKTGSLSRTGVLFTLPGKGWASIQRLWLCLLGLSLGLLPGTGRAQPCNIFPLALPASALTNAATNAVLSDIFQGTQAGNFGWLTWTGGLSDLTLVASLTAPGNSSTYLNPSNALDHQVSVGDWVRGKPSVSNSKSVRGALDALKQLDITVPVWNQTQGTGDLAVYRVSAFARVRLLSYQLSVQNRIGARFLGYTTCAAQNLAPLVNAGPDLNLTLPATATLIGSVSDDGLPAGSSLTQSWSLVSGPGTVTFGDSNAAVTTAAFGTAGTYVLRLTATDSALRASDDVSILVNRENRPPIAFAQTVTNQEDNAVVIPLQATDPDGDTLTWFIDTQPLHGKVTLLASNAVRYVPDADYAGSDQFTFHARDGLLNSSVAMVTVTNVPVNDPPVAVPMDITTVEDTPVALPLSGSDVEGAPITFTLRTPPASGSLTNTGTNYLYVPQLNFHGSDRFTYVADDGALTSAVATVSITVISINDRPIVSAGPDTTNLFTMPLTLAGTATDLDGLPTNGPVSVVWEKVAGPGEVTFSDAHLTNTTVSFSQSGIYVLRLTATDTADASSDDVTVTVLPPNQVPSVSAGKNQLVVLPGAAILKGVVTDDGLPLGGALSWRWSAVSGSGTVTFDNDAATNTTATFSAAGNYVVRLTADDGALTNHSELTLVVRKEATNAAPVVNAGADNVVGLTHLLDLHGTAADDGLPQGAPLSVQWTKVSGPGSVTFGNDATTNTHATFSALGTYVLRLTATDSALSGSDEVTVTVYPYNLPPVVNAGVDQEIIVPDPALLRSDAPQPTNEMILLSRSLSSSDHWNPSIGQPGLTVHPKGGGNIGADRNGLFVDRGAVYVAGTFAYAGTNRVGSLAKWDGTNWSDFYDPRPDPYPGFYSGTNIGWNIYDCHDLEFCSEALSCVAVRGQELFGGGFFKNLTVPSDGQVDVSSRWTGTGWESWTFQRLGGQVRTIRASADKVYLAGDFIFQPTNASPLSFLNLPVSHDVAVWDGTNWGTLGSGMLNVPNTNYGDVFALEIGPTGAVYVAGRFVISTPLGWATNIARWTGAQWEPVGGGILGPASALPVVNDIEFAANGDLYASGTFTNAGGVSVRNIARWDGTNWWPLGSGPANGVNDTAEAMFIYGRDVFVGGRFLEAGGLPATKVARWNGAVWRPLPNTAATNTPQIIMAMAGDETGVYIGGIQTVQSGLHVNGITKWEFAEPPPLGVLLQGHVTDDGLPTGALLTAQWTKVSGPGSVTFSNPNGAVSYARFSAVGTYVLRLTASDTDLTGLDEVTITVRGNEPPIASAGPDQTTGRNEPIILRGAVSDDGLPKNASVLYQWSLISPAGSTAVTFSDPNATNTTVQFSSEGVYLLRLAANDSQFSTFDEVLIVVSGINTAPFLSFQGQNTPGLPGIGFASFNVSDDGFPSGITHLFWTQVSGPAPVAFSNATAAATHITFTAPGSYQLRLTASDTELTTSSDLNFFVTGPAQPPLTGNSPPVVNAGPNLTAVARESFQLNARVSDDGNPSGGTLVQGWSVVGFTDRVFFSDSRQSNATAVINTPGIYTLRYGATDGQMGSVDDVVVTVVAPINEPPLVYAGADFEVTRPEPAVLSGVILDDGLPLPYSLAVQWTKVSGPGNVIFDLTATNFLPLLGERAGVRADFTAPGVYVLSLTASDPQFTASDEITVTVHEGINSPPVVNAGPDLAAILNTLTPLQTTATDDGLPQGLLEVSWSKVSGPGGVSFSTLNGVYQALFDTPGIYVLRLTADDTQLAWTDDVAVTVYDSPNLPIIAILSPLDASIVTAPTIVTGTVGSVVLQSWTLEYRLKPADSDSFSPTAEEGGAISNLQSSIFNLQWTPLSNGTTTVTTGPLATFDPTLLLNGIYELRLTATDILERTAITEPVTIIVDRNMKVGHVTLSFNDLTIPVAGIPIQVTRTYDSRDKRVGDFGVGWTLDLKNIRLQKNRHLGRAWDQSSTGGLLPTYCLDSAKPRFVTITFPDGKVQKFQMTLAPTCQALSPLIYPDAVFVPIGGSTFGTLTPLFEFNGETVTDEQLVFGAFEGIPGRGDFISFERLVNPPPARPTTFCSTPICSSSNHRKASVTSSAKPTACTASPIQTATPCS